MRRERKEGGGPGQDVTREMPTDSDGCKSKVATEKNILC